MLRIRNLEAGYGQLRVLQGVSLHVKPGEIVTIIGANGAGKSTLLNSVAGLLRAQGGEVLLQGKDIRRMPAQEIVRLGCALVPEGRQLFATMTVEENLTLASYAWPGGAPRADVAAEKEKVFEMFPVLEERSNQLAGTLSGGEQQMLAIGRALLSRPTLVLLDEPSIGLAPIIVQEIFRSISALREAGRTILLVEQNARAALRIADRGYVMETGQIVLEGTAQELLHNNDVQRAYLGKEYAGIGDRG